MANLSESLEQLKEVNFSEIDWDKIGVWPAAAKILLCVIVVIALAIATYFFIVKDKNTQLEKVVREEQQLRKTFEGKAADAANLDKYRQQMVEMQESFEALKKQLPRDTEVPDLIEDLDEKVVSSRLASGLISLQPERPSEFYVEQPLEIKVSGGYHEFGSFVSGVAGMPRIVTLHDFSITKGKAGGLDMTIQAKTYRYKEQE